jgi:hypothetical protein
VLISGPLPFHKKYRAFPDYIGLQSGEGASRRPYRAGFALPPFPSCKDNGFFFGGPAAAVKGTTRLRIAQRKL